MVNIFLTGATGYIGGDVLYKFATLDTSKFRVSCLVRSTDKAAQMSKAYPSVRIVQGNLDDSHIIEHESRNADVALHLASTGHSGSAAAIARGLNERSTQRPGYWVQISGATLLAGQEIAEKRFGSKGDRVFDDMSDAEDILTLISKNPKRVVENLVISQDSFKVKAALVIGPLIYGEGRGPVNTRSIQAPEIARLTLQEKEGFRLGEGRNSWSNIHVHDLSNLVLELVGAATSAKSGVWNKDGIYFPENGQMEFGELSSRIAAAAQSRSLIPDATIKRVISADEAEVFMAHGSILWGTNAVGKSSRARSRLGWKPSGASLENEILNIVQCEAEKRSKQIGF
ncbi:NAD(P)-binding protein [Zopfia rhizophila CBS 207.26]|uniref:NAD(P)-binding protein n=1 Tax=Zopfia rhizophila CBS 207.26 TaxID=1314779 RepID=A0A6A6DN78_9PEZI|nr:NAD(P)-binding protein [Zopfia rhizophila CBS 207.26]